MTQIGLSDAERFIGENLAPWVQDMNLKITHIGSDKAVLCAPISQRLNRIGGTVCGQAIMALADTSMIFAIAGFLGEFRPLTTVSQTSAFLRPASDADLIAEARIIKPGRNIMYGEVNLVAGDPDKLVAHITSTYMLL